MVFNSAIFLFCFFPCVFLLSRLVKGTRGRQLLLCAASLVFYAFGEPLHVLLLVGVAAVHYLLGAAMAKTGRKKLLCALGVTADVLLLCFYKYTPLLGSAVGGRLPVLNAPLGLSFFLFQAISYLVDVYRREEVCAESFLSLLLYLSFFPRLLSGPLVRYADHAEQSRLPRVEIGEAAAGWRRFVRGLGKKLLLSDMLGKVADGVFALSPAALTPALAWLGAISYSLQLYFDFSGYSDMSIGMGRIFGYRFDENFDCPYAALGLTDFWRRWHVTLSHWFRDYVYIPLGGNRRGAGRTALNKLCVFLLTGLWHGANWTFALWGLWHGAFMMLESTCPRFFASLKKTAAGRLALRVYTLLVVVFGFVLFRSPDPGTALSVGGRMLSLSASPEARAAATLFLQRTMDGAHSTAFLAAILLSFVPRQREPEGGRELLADALSLGLFVLCLLALSGSGFTPFIYGRF